jgi:hypothetical protein
MTIRAITLSAEDAAEIFAGTRSELHIIAQRKGERIVLPPYKIGDLLWVREPYVIFEGRRKPEYVGVSYGHVGRSAVWPPHLKNIDCRVKPVGAEKMPRVDSRLTLEVTGVHQGQPTVTTLRFTVHAMNINALLKERTEGALPCA